MFVINNILLKFADSIVVFLDMFFNRQKINDFKQKINKIKSTKNKQKRKPKQL